MVKAQGDQRGTRDPILAEVIIQEVRAVCPQYPKSPPLPPTQLPRLLHLWEVAVTGLLGFPAGLFLAVACPLPEVMRLSKTYIRRRPQTRGAGA